VAVELHLPELPEVPISLGPLRTGAARTRAPWHLRVRDAISAYLPLLLMLLLALFTWWLVKNTPNAPGDLVAPAARHEADYTMNQFTLERFDASGRLKVRVSGTRMRHFPDTERYEIDEPQMRAIAPDGRVTLASARKAISNGDASELQLLGSAQVTSLDANGKPIEMSGEFLHAYLTQERVHSHLPVLITVAGSRVSAAGLDYDHGQRKLELQGPMRAVFPARSAKR
jgi:lipopolysaccharide export system protein LptC